MWGRDRRKGRAYILEHSNYSEHPYSSLYCPSTLKLQCILYSNEFLLLKYNTFHVDSCQYLLQLLAVPGISSHLYGKKLGIKLWTRWIYFQTSHLWPVSTLPIQPETREKNNRGMLINWQVCSLHCNETLSCYHLCELSFRVWPTWRQIKRSLEDWGSILIYGGIITVLFREGELIHFRSLQGKSQLHWISLTGSHDFELYSHLAKLITCVSYCTVLPGSFWERDPQQAAVRNSTAENSTMLVIS